jgi:GGDEF domain-containing protein
MAMAAGAAAVVSGDATAGAAAGLAGAAAAAVAVGASRRADASDQERNGVIASAEAEREALGQSQARIRSLEAALSVPPPAPDTDQLLNDNESGLPGKAYFAVSLDARVESARRHLRPVAIVLLEVTEPTGLPANARFVASTLRATLRSADTACRLEGDRRYGLILEDTPEAGAVWTVERFRRALTARATQPHVVSAGVACYPAHAFTADDLRQQAIDALDAARNWRQDRIEVATPADF